jgi:hypothetical protein
MTDRSTSAVPARHRPAADPPRKTGWQVRSSVADAVRRAVDEGAAPSQNAFVEQALVRALREVRRRRVYDAYAAAAADPAFLRDMDQVTESFAATVGDGLGDGNGE